MALAFIHNKRPGIAVVKKSHTHSYTSVVTPPTCLDKGYTAHICSCGYSYKDNYVDPLGHDFSDEWMTNESEHWHTCSRCGERDNIGTHIPDRSAATNTDPIKCTVCGYIIAPALCSHNWGERVLISQATCTEKGKWERTCSLCGAVGTEDIPALGHQLNSTITKYATCATVGERYYWCDRCGHNYTEAIPATGAHTEQPIGAVAATCTSEGSSAGSKCAVCETFLVEPTILPLVPHTPSKTWTRSDSYHWKECTQCGTLCEETYGLCDKDGYGDVAQKASCLYNEVRFKACSVCGRQYTSVVEVPGTAYGHSPSSLKYKYATEATHYAYKSCTVCGMWTNSKELEHSWVNITGGKQCSKCGYTVENPPEES